MVAGLIYISCNSKMNSNEMICRAAYRGDYYEKGWPSGLLGVLGQREDTWPNEGYIASYPQYWVQY